MPRAVRIKKICAPKPKRIPEKSIQNEVIYALGLKGFICKRCPPSIYSSGGWPDYVVMRKGLVLFLEFKAEDGVQSAGQKQFEIDVKYAGCHYLLIRSWADMEAAILRITGVAERKLL